MSRTARGLRRQERILDVAEQLFDEHGFHATSIDDIGVAAGITGPGLYRHFDSKDALLTAVFDRVWQRLRPSVDAARDAEPAAAIPLLLDAHLDLAFEHPVAVKLLLRELRNLPEDYQRLAHRTHQRYVDAWATPLAALHDLERDRARALALAAHGLLDSAATHPGVGAPACRRDLLRCTAMRILMPAAMRG